MSGFGVGTVELYSKTSAYCFLQFERHYREFMIALNIADWIDTEQFQNICRWNFSSISFCKDKKLFNFFDKGSNPSIGLTEVMPRAKLKLRDRP